MINGLTVERQRTVEIPRRGNQICELLDRTPFLQARQTGDHRTYKHSQTGEIVTILNKRKDLRDTNPKVYFRVVKTLKRWGVSGN